MRELGFDAAGAKSPSGGPIPERALSRRQSNQLNNNNNQVGAASQDGSNGGGQAASGAGGGGGAGAGAAAGGGGSFAQNGNQSDTFDGFNNFDGSDTSKQKSKSLEISPALGKAISEQGAKSILPESAKFKSGGQASGNLKAAAYNGGSPSNGLRNNSVGAAALGGAQAGQGDNGIVAQAANFFKGAFGIGGSGSRSGGKGYVDNGAGKVRFNKLAAHKTKSPEQVLKEKWRRMHMGRSARRGLASAPRGMLDARTNIFHGMCMEYAQFASEIGSTDAGYCPPAQ